MTNKWFAGLLICGLAMGMVSCSDGDSSDDPMSLEECTPSMLTLSRDLNAKMKAAGTVDVSANADLAANITVCGKKGEAISSWYSANEQSIKDSGDEYTNAVSKDGWNSVGKVLCKVYAGVLMSNVYAELMSVRTQMDECKKAIANDSAASEAWSTAVSGFTNVNTWTSAMEAAITANANASTQN